MIAPNFYNKEVRVWQKFSPYKHFIPSFFIEGTVSPLLCFTYILHHIAQKQIVKV